MDIRQATETIAMIEEQKLLILEPLPWGFPLDCIDQISIKR